MYLTLLRLTKISKLGIFLGALFLVIDYIQTSTSYVFFPEMRLTYLAQVSFFIALAAVAITIVLVALGAISSPLFRATLSVHLFAFGKIPLLFSVRPIVREVSDKKCVIEIPLTRWTKNHLNSMYFGALAIGADCAGGLIAMENIRRRKEKVSLVFKDFHAEFLKRPEGDVHFICQEGEQLQGLVEKTVASKERENQTVEVVAVVPSRNNELVARFQLTISLKAK